MVIWMMQYTILLVPMNVNWNSDNRKWNLNAYQFDNDNAWNDGNCVIVRYSSFIISSHVVRGNFLCFVSSRTLIFPPLQVVR